MDVFVLSSDYEGSPLSVVEANGFLVLPIVSMLPVACQNSLTTARRFHRAAGRCQRALDAIAYSEGSGSQTVLRNRCRAASKRNFDLSRMVRAYEELYENLIGRLHSQKTSRTLPERVTPTEEQLMGRGNQWGA